jgi:hypothetical protein
MLPAKLTLMMVIALGLHGPVEARTKARPPVDQDPAIRGQVSGIGIEQQDVVAMADRMVRDMLAEPALAARQAPPQIIIDSAYFTNESSQTLNKNMITDRLRVELNRAARGRFVFVSRQDAGMVAEERALKRDGMVDLATTGLAAPQAGGDFRLRGRITSTDSRDGRTGTVQRFTQVSFEMVDLERGVIAWSNIYDASRAATDDVVYR